MLKKLLWLLIVLLSVWWTFAFDIPSYDGYVTDVADILTVEQEQDLESQIFSFVKETSSQVWVLIIPSTEWEDIAMLAVDVGNKRWVGEEDFDNGIVIVIAIEDRKWFIAVGYGLEWTIPDAIAKRIGENDFPDFFRASDYYGWLDLAISDIYSYIKNDPTVVHMYQESVTSSWDDFDPGFIFILFLFLAWRLGRVITSPDPKDKKKRKMTKESRLKYALIGWAISLIIFGFMWAIVWAIILAYGWLWILVAIALAGLSWGKGWMMFFGWWWSWGFSSWGSSSFGWFGWGSFGGGGWGGSR